MRWKILGHLKNARESIFWPRHLSSSRTELSLNTILSHSHYQFHYQSLSPHIAISTQQPAPPFTTYQSLQNIQQPETISSNRITHQQQSLSSITEPPNHPPPFFPFSISSLFSLAKQMPQQHWPSKSQPVHLAAQLGRSIDGVLPKKDEKSLSLAKQGVWL